MIRSGSIPDPIRVDPRPDQNPTGRVVVCQNGSFHGGSVTWRRMEEKRWTTISHTHASQQTGQKMFLATVRTASGTGPVQTKSTALPCFQTPESLGRSRSAKLRRRPTTSSQLKVVQVKEVRRGPSSSSYGRTSGFVPAMSDVAPRWRRHQQHAARSFAGKSKSNPLRMCRADVGGWKGETSTARWGRSSPGDLIGGQDTSAKERRAAQGRGERHPHPECEQRLVGMYSGWMVAIRRRHQTSGSSLQAEGGGPNLATLLSECEQ